MTSVSCDHEGSINSTLLISWSQSNCAVQYVVTIINSSDDRVYLNITTSNTNTTVTLPTGVEFCVTLVAVDSIGRRGPDTTSVCYGEMSINVHTFELTCIILYAFIVSPVRSSVMGVFTDVNQLSTISVAMNSIDQKIGPLYRYIIMFMCACVQVHVCACICL